MTRCSVSLTVATGASLSEHRTKMKDLARRIEGMHPDVVVERVGPIMIIVQVPDELVSVIRHDLGCTVDDAPGQPLVAEGA